MAVWSFQAVDAPHVASGGARGSFATANSRSLTLSKDDPSSCTWAIPYYSPGTNSRSQDVQLIVPRATDLVVWRDAAIMFRGRITTHEVSFEDTGQLSVNCTASSYKEMLDHRYLMNEDCVQVANSSGSANTYQRNYTASADVASIAWDLIKAIQAKANGTLGILSSTDGFPNLTAPTAMTTTTSVIPSAGTQAANNIWTGGNGNTGLHPTGVVEFTVGQSIKECIDSMAAGNGTTTTFGAGVIDTEGFDWDIIPDQTTGQLRLHVWPKNNASAGRGVKNGYVLDFGGTISSGKTSNAFLDTFANVIRVSAGEQYIAQQLGAGTAADGRWEKIVSLNVPLPLSGDPLGIVLTPMYQAAADAFYYSSKVIPSYVLNMRPTAWQLVDGPQLGDTCVVQVPSLEGTMTDTQRVLGLKFDISEDGNESVSLSVGAPPLFTVGAQAKRINDANALYRKLQKAIWF